MCFKSDVQNLFVRSLIFVSGLFIVSCNLEYTTHEGKNHDQSIPITPLELSSPIPTPTASPEAEARYYNVDDFTYQLKPSDTPHIYDLMVLWPKSNYPVSISINKKVLKTIKPGEGNSFNTSIPDKTKIHLQILNGLDDTLKEWDFETPLDFIFASTEKLSQDTEVKAARIYFKNKSLIETSGYNFTITADEIFFEEGAKIINFQSPPNSSPQKEGINGGNISITARKAYGKFEFDLSGGNGGKGIEAFPYFPQAATGKDGAPAVAVDVFKVCKSQPGNGEPGADGHKGKPGFPGMKGGDSGKLSVIISAQSEVEFIHNEKPGHGGEGGEGGMGQMGGFPGKAGAIDPNGYCSPASDGPATSKNGEPGDQGPIGPDGEIGTICISIGRGSDVCKK